MKFSVDKTVFEKFPGVRLGVVVGSGVNNKNGVDILKFLRDQEEEAKSRLVGVTLSEHQFIASWREAYRMFGSKPNEFNSSVEALAKRVQKGNPLPDINPLVNLYNALSIKYLLPFGGEDLDKVKGDIRLAFAAGTEKGEYIGSNKEDTCYPGEVVYLDDLGFICRRWNWREADRTKLMEDTKNVILVAEALPPVPDSYLKQAVEELSSLLRENLGGKTSIFYLDKQSVTLEIDFVTGTKLMRLEENVFQKEIVSKEKNKNLKQQKKLSIDRSKPSEFYSGPAKIIYVQLKKMLREMGFPESQISLEHPAVEEHGDYASNIALAIFDEIRNHKSEIINKIKSPRELAEKIVEALSSIKEFEKAVSRIEVAGPGFINFWLNEDVLTGKAEEVIKLKDSFGSSNSGSGKTFIIDYSSPNIAKRFTVGHLRSTIIGQAIYNLYKFCGWKGIGDNHLGDWGTQFGKMIVAIKKWAGKTVDELTIDEMESLYVRFHQEVEKDDSLEKEARQAFKNLEDGKKEEREMWKKLVNRSMEEFQKIYDLLNVKIDAAHGESFYEDMMPSVVEEAKKKGVAVESKGALIILYPNEALPPSMLLKSDGATTYLTRDLATIKFRKEKWNPDLVIYEVGAEQVLYFRQVFWAVELLGWAERKQFFHIPHGLIRSKEGKMSTRKGNVVKLEQVLAEAIDRAKKFNDDSEISKMVGIGAVKYNDLKHSPTTGYVFDWGEMITLEGNSGPYLQYTFARTQSVLQKSEIRNPKSETISKSEIRNYKLNPEELAILRWIYRFPEVVMEAVKQYAPNLLCTFLYELAQRFNTFYNKHRILEGNKQQATSNNEQGEFRLLLTAAVGQTLKNGLTLLGIQTPEKM